MRSRSSASLETHTHADHVSGHGRLALEHGAPVSIHALAQPSYDPSRSPTATGSPLGDVVVRVIHTPGHRPEHCCFASPIVARDEPWLLTGDSLFVGDAARPDLAAEAREGAEGLFYSLRRLAELPDGVDVYPGHVAGSLCGASISSDPVVHDRLRAALQPHAPDRARVDDFIADALSKTTPRPPNMDRIVELNRGPFVGAPDAARAPRRPDAAASSTFATADDFAAGARPARGQRAALGLVASRRAPASSSGRRAADDPRRFRRPGRSGGSRSERGRRLRARRLRRRSAGHDVAPRPGGPRRARAPVQNDEVVVLDVRESDERDEGYIPGIRHMPYRLLAARLRRARRAAGGHDLHDGRACRDRREPPRSARDRRTTRPRRRRGDWEQRGGRTIEFRRCGYVGRRRLPSRHV